MSARTQGVVKWFNPTKGFGFITVDGRDDCFVHINEVKKSGLDELLENDKVEFDLEPSKKLGKGPCAANIKVLR